MKRRESKYEYEENFRNKKLKPRIKGAVPLISKKHKAKKIKIAYINDPINIHIPKTIFLF